ncbi:MAG: hypothetical protein IKF00_10300 [Solobacterium sp.]|nr:hypothetical protein [Solobacterium sp.]
MKKENVMENYDPATVYEFKDSEPDIDGEPTFTKQQNKGANLLMITDDGDILFLTGDNVIKVSEHFSDHSGDIGSLIEEIIQYKSKM